MLGTHKALGSILSTTMKGYYPILQVGKWGHWPGGSSCFQPQAHSPTPCPVPSRPCKQAHLAPCFVGFLRAEAVLTAALGKRVALEAFTWCLLGYLLHIGEPGWGSSCDLKVDSVGEPGENQGGGKEQMTGWPPTWTSASGQPRTKDIRLSIPSSICLFTQQTLMPTKHPDSLLSI